MKTEESMVKTMSEKKLREYFDAYYDTHINGTMLNREAAWEIWKTASKVTETYLKG